MQITIKNLQNKLPVRRERIKKSILRILKTEGIKKPGNINICFARDRLIREFNAKFLNTDSPTDVLAFNLSDKTQCAADIIISSDMAIKNALKFNTDPEYELMLYVIHGVLHILGYDDHNKTQLKLMRKKEAEYVDR